MTNAMISILETVIRYLVAGDYDDLVQFTDGVRLDRESIKEFIDDYGRTLAPVPRTCLENSVVVQIDNASVPSYYVRVALWTVEEGMSDLSMEVTLRDEPSGLKVELDNIHVL